MARIVVTGAGGFLGKQVIDTMCRQNTLTINGCSQRIESILAVDRFIPDAFKSYQILNSIEGELSEIIRMYPTEFHAADVVVHLASAVSGECEQYLDLGLDTNLTTGIELGRVIAASPKKPILIFSSSLAIYGGTDGFPMPQLITDDVWPNPQNSYGAQKLMLELLYADLARRQLISSRTVRLMTVVVRPGIPNNAASSFLSGMIREPLSGEESNIPVSPEIHVALNSPTQAIDGLIQCMGISNVDWGSPLGLNLPGIRVTVQQMIDALGAVGGSKATALLSRDIDPKIEQIISGWPSRFESKRAARLGLSSTITFADVVRRFNDQI